MLRLAILVAAALALSAIRADAQFSGGGGAGGGCAPLLLSAGSYTCTIGTNGCAISCSGGGGTSYLLIQTGSKLLIQTGSALLIQ